MAVKLRLLIDNFYSSTVKVGGNVGNKMSLDHNKLTFLLGTV